MPNQICPRCGERSVLRREYKIRNCMGTVTARRSFNHCIKVGCGYKTHARDLKSHVNALLDISSDNDFQNHHADEAGWR